MKTRYWIDKYGVAMPIHGMGDRHLYYTIRMLRRQALAGFEDRIQRIKSATNPAVREVQLINLARASGVRSIEEVSPDDFAPIVLTYLLEEAKKRGVNPYVSSPPDSNIEDIVSKTDETSFEMEIPTRIIDLS